MARIDPQPKATCASFFELLPWFLNGGLEADEHARVRSHLIRCASCRAESRELSAQMTLLADLRRQQVAESAAISRTHDEVFIRRIELPAEYLSRPVRLAAALALAFILGSVLSPSNFLSQREHHDLVTAQSSDTRSVTPVFDEGFESGSLANWQVILTNDESDAQPDDASPTS